MKGADKMIVNVDRSTCAVCTKARSGDGGAEGEGGAENQQPGKDLFFLLSLCLLTLSLLSSLFLSLVGYMLYGVRSASNQARTDYDNCIVANIDKDDCFL